MATCKKCKKNLGIFNPAYDCANEDCTNKYCSACSDTELVECKYCGESYCKKCLEEHTPDCKEENENVSKDEDEDTSDDDDEEMPDGMYFNKDKTMCILDIDNNVMSDFIEHLPTLRKDFIIDKELSNDKELVWVKKV